MTWEIFYIERGSFDLWCESHTATSETQANEKAESYLQKMGSLLNYARIKHPDLKHDTVIYNNRTKWKTKN